MTSRGQIILRGQPILKLQRLKVRPVTYIMMVRPTLVYASSGTPTVKQRAAKVQRRVAIACLHQFQRQDTHYCTTSARQSGMEQPGTTQAQQPTPEAIPD